MFVQRKPNSFIAFIDKHIGPPSKKTIENGDTVMLFIGEECVLVQQVFCLGEDNFKGIVCGFETKLGVAAQEIQLRQEVEFQKIHVFGCW
jgi:hypothetical protein